MGKSEEESGTIFLDDAPEVVWKKLKPAKTDPARVRRYDPGNPELCPVGQIHGTLEMLGVESSEVWQEVQEGCKTASIGCVDCKKLLNTELVNILDPLQQRHAELVAQGPGYVEDVIREGNQRMRQRIAPVVHEAMELMGVSPYTDLPSSSDHR
jgi:tryptophanyl-tRNA synthetase